MKTRENEVPATMIGIQKACRDLLREQKRDGEARGKEGKDSGLYGDKEK